jgi:hypothetical protein
MEMCSGDGGKVGVEMTNRKVWGRKERREEKVEK